MKENYACSNEKGKKLHKIIAAHCEDNSLVRGGCIHDGNYADRHSPAGICSESEWRPIARDIELVRRADVHTMFAMFRQRSPLILSVRQNLKAST